MKRPGVIAIVALCALLVGLLVYGVAKQSDDRSIEAAIKRGERPLAPDARLAVLDGEGTGSIADYRGKVVVLNFWGSWCPPCREEAPVLEAVQRRLGSRGTVLGVTYKDYAPASRTFVREHGLTFPSLRDDKLSLASKYGTTGLPETFVLDRRGRIVAASRGTVTEKWLDRWVKEARRS